MKSNLSSPSSYSYYPPVNFANHESASHLHIVRDKNSPTIDDDAFVDWTWQDEEMTDEWGWNLIQMHERPGPRQKRSETNIITLINAALLYIQGDPPNVCTVISSKICIARKNVISYYKKIFKE